MNGLDWLIVLITLGSALLAAAQGFFFEVISLAGAIAGYLAAAWGYGRIAPWFLPYVKSQAFADLAGFLTIFVAVVLLGGAIARIVRWMVREVGLRWVDRALGAAFGFLRGLVIVTAGLLAITAFAPDSKELAGSHLANYFLVAGGGASWLAPAEIRQKFHDGWSKLRGNPGPGTTKKTSE
ncbi:MAG: CvpA family protein [Acidobacteriia bacterium]|nr:CvpA family protein [Terriglobia bacterium]